MKNISTDPASTRRLKSIDFLRGCAALGVVISHSFPHELPYLSAQSRWFGYLGTVLSRGTLGVPLFFVISGFCIHLRWAKQRAKTGQNTSDFISFWKRRIHRLYPPYAVVLCLSMAMVVTAYLLGRANYYPEPRPRWIAIDFVTHLLMLHGFHPFLDTGGGNPPMWTLAREEYFYLMYFALLAWRRTRNLAGAVFGVFVLGLAFPHIIRPFLPANSPFWQTVNTSAFVYWIQWVLGMVAVEAFYKLTKLPRLFRMGSMVLFWFVLGEVSSVYVPSLTITCWGLTFFTLINYCLSLEQSSRWSNSKMTTWLANVGLFSYSLYLVHYPVTSILRELFTFIASPPNVWIALVGMAIKVIACYFSAKLFFVIVERHFLNSPIRSPDSYLNQANEEREQKIRLQAI